MFGTMIASVLLWRLLLQQYSLLFSLLQHLSKK